MASAKGILLGALSRLVTRSVRVTSIRELGHGLRAIVLSGSELRDVTWIPGDKIQLLLPSRDVRTFTPARISGGELELVAFDHGDAPGSVWSRRAKLGDELRFVGPQRSLRRTSRSVVLFGDETSFGLAIAFSTAPLTPILEVGTDAHATIIADLGVTSATCITRRQADAHIEEIATAIAAAMRSGAELVMSGRAQSIQLVRDRLRALGVTGKPANKPYWSVGKTGLD